MKIGIVGAMEEEIIELKSIMTDKIEHKRGDFSFFEGKIQNKDVILVKSGIGKVNASVTTTMLINIFNVDKIIFTGVAGGLNNLVKVTDIVIGTELIETDMDVTFAGYELGVIPRMKESFFKADIELFNLAKNVAIKLFGEDKVFLERISTRDEFVHKKETTDFLFKQFKAYCTEMEGAALAHVCYLFNIPFVVIRSISDNADHNSNISFDNFVNIASKNSKSIVEEMLKFM